MATWCATVAKPTLRILLLIDAMTSFHFEIYQLDLRSTSGELIKTINHANAFMASTFNLNEKETGENIYVLNYNFAISILPYLPLPMPNEFIFLTYTQGRFLHHHLEQLKKFCQTIRSNVAKLAVEMTSKDQFKLEMKLLWDTVQRMIQELHKRKETLEAASVLEYSFFEKSCLIWISVWTKLAKLFELNFAGKRRHGSESINLGLESIDFDDENINFDEIYVYFVEFQKRLRIDHFNNRLMVCLKRIEDLVKNKDQSLSSHKQSNL